MNVYGVIMAGGGGTRFWPMSRQENPKQLLNLSGKGTMINETIERISSQIEKENIFIVTNVTQAEKMKEVVGDRIVKNHILAEPSARNTSACIGYAAIEIIKKYGDGIMCIFPADHYIENKEEFDRILIAAREFATTDKLVTIGIKPTFPSTGYGYIKFDKKEESVAKKVDEFVEKPDMEKAEEYLASGNYTWNSGMFVWKASTILKAFEKLLPDIYEMLMQMKDAMGTENEKQVIDEVYPNIPKISVDYGIMERADNVVVIEGDFGWNDVGSWDTLQVLYSPDENGNVIQGEQINIDTTNCISFSHEKLIATIGLDQIVIVETKDAILVCSKDHAQDVKMVVDRLKEQGKDKYL